jgi:hypothetical protein
LQYVTVTVTPVAVGPATVIHGDVTSFAAMAAAYDAGYHLDVRATVTPYCCRDYTALDVSVTRSGPFAEHVHMRADTHVTVLDVPAFRFGKATIFAPPGVVMTQDSEFDSVPALAAAVDTHEAVCLAADTFRTATIAYRATRIRAWRAPDAKYTDCED